MCAACNIRHEQNAWPVLRFFKEKFGEAVLEELQKLWNKPRSLATWELREMAVEMENRHKNLLKERQLPKVSDG